MRAGRVTALVRWAAIAALGVTTVAVTVEHRPGHRPEEVRVRFAAQAPDLLPDPGGVRALEGSGEDGAAAVPSSAAAGPLRGADVLTTPSEAAVAATNAQRLGAGCGRLVVDVRLERAAEGHAVDMVRRGYFDHYSPDGGSPAGRAAAEGFTGGVGENLAVGYPSAAAVVAGWMQSPPHRRNILDCGFTRIGVAHLDATIPGRQENGVWVQMFGDG